MNQKKIKKIRRFGKLRFKDNPMYREHVLIDIYEKAGENQRKRLDAEMNDYFQALDANKIKAGDSILKSVLVEDTIKPV